MAVARRVRMCAARSPPKSSHAKSQLRLLCKALHKRRNWIFLGSDDGGEVNATFVTLLASCQLHDIEPSGYLRDIFCLLPGWNQKRVLELAPVNWEKTLEDSDTQQRLDANIFRQVSLGAMDSHRPLK